MTENSEVNVAAAHRLFSAAGFNQAWELLEKLNRTAEDEELLLQSAYASLWHWGQRPDCTEINQSIGFWQLSRIFATLGRAADAKHYGHLCLKASENGPPFYRAYAYEALARASHVAGDSEQQRSFSATSKQLAQEIKDAEERTMLLNDLQSLE